jgi:hypothetical protein
MALHEWRGLSPEAYLRVSVLFLVAPPVVAWVLTGRFPSFAPRNIERILGAALPCG